MSAERKYEPDWENSDTWSEYLWEEALKYSDHLAGRYFHMLDRYGDLPDAEALIATKLGRHEFMEMEEGELYTLESPDDWENVEDDADDDDDTPIGPGDALYFETSEVYRHARQIALGWCNILASVLGPEDRMWGMKMLYHLGRVLSYLALGIGDGTYDRLSASIAFGKRALSEINYVLGEVMTMAKEKPRYAGVLDYIREHLLKAEKGLVDFLLDCRKRQENSGLKPER